MNQTSVTRRLLTGAAGLVVGAASVIALASPAQAWERGVSFADDCDGTTVTITNDGTPQVWSITTGGSPFWPGPNDTQPGPHSDTPIDVPSDAGEIAVDYEGSPDGWPMTHTWQQPEGCDDGGGGEQPPELPEGTVFPAVTCDFLIFFVINEDVAEGVSIALTPNEDAVHGHAPGFLEFGEELRDNPGTVVEIPEGLGLEGTQEVAGGETVGPLGPFGPGFPPGDRHAHGFEAFEGLSVDVDVFIGQGEDAQLVSEETVVWSGEGLNCEAPTTPPPANGGGGELPKTGISTALIAGGALALLALGGGLYLVARRRRVTFTA